MNTKKLTLALMGATLLSANALAKEPDYDANGFATGESNPNQYQEPTKIDGVYQIANAGNLYWFANFVNQGGDNVFANVILTKDIVINENVLDNKGGLNGTPARTWTPIGTEDFSYRGVFDGNGHTISGLYVDNEDANYVGLFGKMGDLSLVKKLGIVDSYLKGNKYVGSICGYAFDAKIDSCYSAGVVKGHEYVGGLFGEVSCNFDNNDGDNNMNNMYVTNCHNEGSVEGDGDGNYIGGIAGQIGSRMENCYNVGTVVGTEKVGGIGGYIYLNGLVKECYNKGKIKGESHVGGLTGEMLSHTSIINCYNSGKVNSVYVGAGLCCINEGLIVNSYANGTITIGGRASGICLENNGTIVNCYYDNTKFTGNAILVDNSTSTVYGNTSAQFADGTVATALHDYDNGETGYANINGAIWGQYVDVDGVPTFRGYVKFNPTQITEGDYTGYYALANADDLYWFANFVNQGGDNLNANAILTDDIVVNTEVLVDGELNKTKTFREWTPIGNEVNPYKGTFDGKGKTISGLYFDNSNQSYVGLFGYNKGTIKNVGVVDSYFKGNQAVGGVCGYNFSTIENCYNTGEVSGSKYIGGVCGINNYGTITNCYNTGKVSGTENIGGVCGENYGTIKNCYNTGAVSGSVYIGGVCGANAEGTIENCYNTGVVSGGEESKFIGGVCGYNFESNITNCYNTGVVSGGEKSEYIGGVCGYNYGPITNCYNTGEVSGNSTIGGVCGFNNATIENCYDFKVDGGTLGEYSIVVDNNKITLPTEENISLDGFNLEGWCANEDLTDDAITSEAEFSDVHTLYAKWVEPSDPTAIKAVESENNKTIKTIKDGQIVIIRNGVMYDMQGRKL